MSLDDIEQITTNRVQSGHAIAVFLGGTIMMSLCLQVLGLCTQAYDLALLKGSVGVGATCPDQLMQLTLPHITFW